MMLSLKTSTRFKKDLQKLLAQGKNYEKFRSILETILNQQPIDPKYLDHPLIGNWKGRRELHIEPDWLLIYKIDDDILILERTGTLRHLFS